MTTPDLAGLCERLRAYRPINQEWERPEHHVICDEAAAAIERLVAALDRIANTPSGMSGLSLSECISQARTALEGASDDR